MLKSEKHPQQLLQTNVNQLSDADEGGLNLGQVGSTLRRRALLIAGITGVVATAAVLKAETDPPVYQGQFEILTKPVTGETKAIVNVPQAISGQIAPEAANEISTTIKVLESPRLLNPVVKNLQKKYPDLTYTGLVSNLEITSQEQNILSIEYADLDEAQVTDVLQALSEVYRQYSLDERQKDVKEAIKFVKERINKGGLLTRVQEWQNRLRNLRQTNNLVEPAQKAQEISSHIASLTQQQLENRIQYEQMLAQYNDLQRELAQQPSERTGNSILSANARYQKILDEIQQADIVIRKQSAIFKAGDYHLDTATDTKDGLLPLLKIEEERVQRDFQSRVRELAAKDGAIGQKITNLNAYLRTLATVSRDYDNIQLQLKIATDNLNQFLTKQQALEIEEAQRLQLWQLLDPELTQVNEPSAVSDSVKRNLALGVMLGLLLGTGAALIIDKLSNVFYTSKDLKESALLPLLGVVPARKELATLGLQDSTTGELLQPNRAAFFEVFRSLYTNILLLGSDAPIRSLVISSAQHGDGKSTVAVYLALAAAAMGQRVLLVDANLRCPTLHQRLGLMNIQGLTDVISSDLEWSNVIERSPIEDNLYVLSAGPIPPDSVRLLASQKMQDLMNDLQTSFDLVIYDTPPVVGFADANLLAANTNGMVLVAGLGKLKRTLFKEALDELQISGTPILGMVANKSKDALSANYSHYQQYYRQNVSVERINTGEQNQQSSSSSSIRRIGGR
ncbi:GumC family protein [Calothrix sp. PCC 6303]|uniref:GumC family protein n=1 Tax=Calothrix sp. PCC 6303 TaxID=1170562 RepID=UPI0002A01395|nr:tyrosine-protein kinase domain-containing protein [Calothrix sp. PCC 6303]AFZ01163.1 capsular exopolysaccharide family [Calothrix sp. PCC 6303]